MCKFISFYCPLCGKYWAEVTDRCPASRNYTNDRGDFLAGGKKCEIPHDRGDYLSRAWAHNACFVKEQEQKILADLKDPRKEQDQIRLNRKKSDDRLAADRQSWECDEVYTTRARKRQEAEDKAAAAASGKNKGEKRKADETDTDRKKRQADQKKRSGQKIKDEGGSSWEQTRKFNQDSKMAEDPEYAASVRKEKTNHQKIYRKEVKADPERLEPYKESQARTHANWWDREQLRREDNQEYGKEKRGQEARGRYERNQRQLGPSYSTGGDGANQYGSGQDQYHNSQYPSGGMGGNQSTNPSAGGGIGPGPSGNNPYGGSGMGGGQYTNPSGGFGPGPSGNNTYGNDGYGYGQSGSGGMGGSSGSQGNQGYGRGNYGGGS